ncbi:aldo/keto reductase [Paradesertivirga mongoliensis]|uniref:Aldo/keto reductase n=1 Tax=Paradesertivirga mongoliensis TaxID=2100740 RepID=A0ABW4ZGV0_9SPHI|nr:aldo/keto reductase [Pedobacter mongoliensis]
MHYRKFRNVSVSEVGLGTWQLGSADWGNIREEDAFAILNRFVSLGGNFIDTADVYGMGISESYIGKFLKTTDRELFVASKLGRRGDGTNGWPQNFSYDGMRSHIESSLKNLDLSSLFLEQLHCIPEDELRKGVVFGHLRKFQQEGLIQNWGVSVETAEEALLCLEQEGLASLQIIFNIFRQHYADEFFEKAAEKGVALIVRVPLASGLLSGKYNLGSFFAKTDHRNYNANGDSFNVGETFSGIEFSKGVKLADHISGMLPDGRTAQWAIRWILDHPQVTTVIPGATRVAQVESNIAASDLVPLPKDTHRQLQELYEDEIKPFIRGRF